MSETYTSGRDNGGGMSSSIAGAGARSSQARRSGPAGYRSHDVGGSTSARPGGYDDHRSAYRADDLIPVVGVVVGGAVGYLLAAMFSDRRTQSRQRGGRGTLGRASSDQYGAGMSTGTGASSADSVETDETTDLIASNKVEGTAVYDRQGERLGEVYNFMVGKRSGRVAYAVLSFGGFLGIGQRYHALPWNVLTYDTSRGGYVIDANRDRLMAAPSHEAGQDPFSQTEQMRQIRDYWSSGQLAL